MIGYGFPDRYLTAEQVQDLVTQALDRWDLSGQRVLILIPDSTRTIPLPFFFRLFHEGLSGKAAALDFLVALGTHPLMDDTAINRLLGITPEERTGRYADVHIFNHRWDLPETFINLGAISEQETSQLSQGRLSLEVPVRINRAVLDYDVVVVCGPVFPHEVVGFSGGSKYFFPGIGGSEVINFTHWLGALITSYAVIGTRDTPVREAIERAAGLIPTPKLFFCSVVGQEGLNGLFIGDSRDAWAAAAGLSAQVHVRYVERPFRQVISQVPPMYADLWTGAKGMYKVEPVVADGGEVILYAPHIREFSYTHGRDLEAIGYHVRDYFVRQWERFKGYPWGVLAHSTHVRGIGSFENGIERPRIRVTLASSIPHRRCESVCLGYCPPNEIAGGSWQGRESEGILFVPHAGEILYRLKEPNSGNDPDLTPKG